MENKKFFGIVVALVLLTAVGVGFTSAQSLPDDFPVFHGFGMFGMGGFAGNQTAAQEMWSAVTNDNYKAWVASVESQLTQENFDRLVNMTRDMNQTRLRDPDFNWTNETGGRWANVNHVPRLGNWTDSDDHPGFAYMNQTYNGTYMQNQYGYERGDHMRAERNPGFFRNQDN
jgi:hypothetical protein